jgi:hypothetical protein
MDHEETDRATPTPPRKGGWTLAFMLLVLPLLLLLLAEWALRE